MAFENFFKSKQDFAVHERKKKETEKLKKKIVLKKQLAK